MHVTRFTERDRQDWNAFIGSSRNGTFLLDRDYMEYHADRFPDCSLIVREDGGDIAAVLPANRVGNIVESHGGLTYGGLIVGEKATVSHVITALDAVVTLLASQDVEALVYKTVPYIYHRAPCEEDRYALFMHSAELIRRDALSVIDYRRPMHVQERRMRAIRKARRAGLEVGGVDDYSAFWSVLARNLDDRYGVPPVHSLAEMSMLASRFSSNIQLFTATRGGETFGGVVVFVTPTVCHVQYNAASPEGKEIGAQDVIFAELIDMFRDRVDYFDFGISNENDGRFLNAGLIEYKTGFGARAVVHDFYQIHLRSSA